MAVVDRSVTQRDLTRRDPISVLGAVLRNPRVGRWAGLVGKLIGLGLFATLVYTYCNVLLESCIRGIH